MCCIRRMEELVFRSAQSPKLSSTSSMYNKVLVPVVWAGSVCTPRNVPCGVFRNRDLQPNRRNLAYLFPWRKVDGREMSRARPESKRRVLRVFGSSVRPFELQDSDDLRMEVLGRQDAHAGRQSLVDCEAFRQFFFALTFQSSFSRACRGATH